MEHPGYQRGVKTNGLINIHHVSQICPRIWIGNWRIGATLPAEGAVFLQKTIKRAAARTAVKPEGDFLCSVWVVRREEPEPECIRVGCVIGDGKGAGIRFANVEVDVRKSDWIQLNTVN